MSKTRIPWVLKEFDFLRDAVSEEKPFIAVFPEFRRLWPDRSEASVRGCMQKLGRDHEFFPQQLIVDEETQKKAMARRMKAYQNGNLEAQAKSIHLVDLDMSNKTIHLKYNGHSQTEIFKLLMDLCT